MQVYGNHCNAGTISRKQQTPYDPEKAKAEQKKSKRKATRRVPKW